MNERDWIESVYQRQFDHPRLKVGPGDDCAYLDMAPHKSLLITSDMIIDKIHFNIESVTPEEIGWKAIAVNLSDIAAMAGQPVACSVGIAAPPGTTLDFLKKIYDGMESICKNFGVCISGGDTSKTYGPLTLCVTAIGLPTEKGPVLRSKAKPGDMILVTGSLGNSQEDKKHLSFTPRVREALELHKKYKVNAMLDISDGLAKDILNLTFSSQCGALLYEDAIPIRTTNYPNNLEKALTDGEDYELLFTMEKEEALRLCEAQPFMHCLCSIVGEITQEPKVMLVKSTGEKYALPWQGFEHKF